MAEKIEIIEKQKKIPEKKKIKNEDKINIKGEKSSIEILDKIFQKK